VNIGKIYRVKKYFWLLYSAKDGVTIEMVELGEEVVKSLAVLLSNRYSRNVTYFLLILTLCFSNKVENITRF
jgi:hypothetical protein